MIRNISKIKNRARLISTVLAGILAFIFAASVRAGCSIESTVLAVTCEEAVALIQQLPELHPQIKADSLLRTIKQIPVYGSDRTLSAISIVFEFEPFHQDKNYVSYVEAICYSGDKIKIQWQCETEVFNRYQGSKRQKTIKFQESIAVEDVREIISIIDESRKLWPRQCSNLDEQFSEPYITSVSYNSKYFEVAFCTGQESTKLLLIARDMNNLKLFPYTVKENVDLIRSR